MRKNKEPSITLAEAKKMVTYVRKNPSSYWDLIHLDHKLFTPKALAFVNENL
jgi:hypothetical protein